MQGALPLTPCFKELGLGNRVSAVEDVALSSCLVEAATTVGACHEMRRDGYQQLRTGRLHGTTSAFMPPTRLNVDTHAWGLMLVFQGHAGGPQHCHHSHWT